MLITVMKSKIHLATITSCQPEYEGSIAICPALIKAAGLIPYEKVAVLNANNGNRFETYVIKGGAGEISLKGPAAKLGQPGDKVIILAYGHIEQSKAKNFKPKKVFVDNENRIK